MRAMKASICTLLARKWELTDMFRRLAAQTEKDFEWVLVDYLYEKNKERFSQQAKEHGIPLVHVPNIRHSYPYMLDIARNRNQALIYASGKTIIFLDDYTAINKDFVEQHLLLTESNILSCGKMYWVKLIELKEPPNFRKGITIDKEFLTVEDMLQAGEHDEDHRNKMLKYPEAPTPVLGDEWTFTGNLAIPIRCVEELNGFDPRLSARQEDCDFGRRAGRAGYEIYYNPLAHSINLPTGHAPYFLPFDHEHDTHYLFEKGAKVDPKILKEKSMRLGAKYGCTVAICNVCNADYILDPATLIIHKIQKSETQVRRDLFDLEKERNKIRNGG